MNKPTTPLNPENGEITKDVPINELAEKLRVHIISSFQFGVDYKECDIEVAKMLTQLENSIRESERRKMVFPFDGLKINIQYRDGDKVLQNQHIFTAEMMNFVKGFSEVAELKFKYMLKDLLSQSTKEDK